MCVHFCRLYALSSTRAPRIRSRARVFESVAKYLDWFSETSRVNSTFPNFENNHPPPRFILMEDSEAFQQVPSATASRWHPVCSRWYRSATLPWTPGAAAGSARSGRAPGGRPVRTAAARWGRRGGEPPVGEPSSHGDPGSRRSSGSTSRWRVLDCMLLRGWMIKAPRASPAASPPVIQKFSRAREAKLDLPTPALHLRPTTSVNHSLFHYL